MGKINIELGMIASVDYAYAMGTLKDIFDDNEGNVETTFSTSEDKDVITAFFETSDTDSVREASKLSEKGKRYNRRRNTRLIANKRSRMDDMFSISDKDENAKKQVGRYEKQKQNCKPHRESLDCDLTFINNAKTTAVLRADEKFEYEMKLYREGEYDSRELWEFEDEYDYDEDYEDLMALKEEEKSMLSW